MRTMSKMTLESEPRQSDSSGSSAVQKRAGED
jgi:hypothetical protein